MKRVRVFLLILSVFGGSMNVIAIDRWEKLGEVTADMTMDRVTIQCSNKGTFRALKFKAERSTIDFDRVVVQYAIGTKDDLRFNQSLEPGAESSVLDLRGSRRVIREVVLYIRSDRNKPGGHGHGKAKGHQGKVIVLGKL